MMKRKTETANDLSRCLDQLVLPAARFRVKLAEKTAP